MLIFSSIGRNIKEMLEPQQGKEYCFRVHKNLVYYLRYDCKNCSSLFSVDVLKFGTCIASDHLKALGVCFGNFTKSGVFRLRITCLDYLAQYALYKVWLKAGHELSFLYGKNVLKAQVAKFTEDTPKYQGVVVLSARGVPLGFGVTARSTEEVRMVEPTAVIVFHQSDSGEYLREEGKTSLF